MLHIGKSTVQFSLTSLLAFWRQNFYNPVCCGYWYSILLFLSCFFDDPTNVGSLISGSSAFFKSNLNIWKFAVHILLKPGFRIFSITLLACEMSAIVQYFEHFWQCLSLRLEWKLTFSSPVATAEFSKFTGILSAVLSQHHLFSSLQSLSRVRLFVTPWIEARQASLSKLPEFTQTHVHRVSDAIQPSHPLLSPPSPAPNPSQHQSLFQWVNSLREVSKVLEFQL